jgi:hypothetical protein
MYNPATQVHVPTDANLGSYYKKNTVGAFPTVFLSKKSSTVIWKLFEGFRKEFRSNGELNNKVIDIN